MTEVPNICVIVPVYKVEAYLKKCVDSLLNQTYQNLSIILVDDGSPDSCPQICDEYAHNNENVIALHKENGGLSSARNYGVQHTETDLIVFVDSDDYVEPLYVETLYKLMVKFNADFVMTKVAREPEGSTVKKDNHKFRSFCADSETALFESYGGGKIGWQAYGKLYHRDILLKYPFPDGYYEDCAVMYKIIHSVDKIAIGDFEGNYHYIDRQGSILRSQLKPEHLHIFDICKEFQQFITDKYPQIDILPVLVYKKGLTQLLHLQSMSKEEYRRFYYQYQPLFRKNLFRVLQDKRITKKSKVHMFLMCMPVWIYQLQFRLNRRIKSHKS